jgi:hypothetical protein
MYLQLAENTYLAKSNKPKDERNKINIVLLAPGRALFLAMCDLNIDGLATKLSRRNFAELRTYWLKAGGDPDKLAKNINKGKGKKPKKIGFLKKFKKGQQLAETANPFLSEELTPQKKAAIISASTAAGIALGTVFPVLGNIAGASGGASLGAVIVEILPIIKKAADDTAGDEEILPPPGDNLPENTGGAGTETETTTTGGLPKWALPVGAAALGLGLIYYFTRTKK